MNPAMSTVAMILQEVPPQGLVFAMLLSYALGWIIPAVIFVGSFVLTWMLYRHFSQKPPQ